MGISITPLKNVVKAINTHGGRSFQALHAHAETIPLRCLACNCGASPEDTDSDSLTEGSPDDLPETEIAVRRYRAEEIAFLLTDNGSEIPNFPPALYDAKLKIYPRRIMVATTEG